MSDCVLLKNHNFEWTLWFFIQGWFEFVSFDCQEPQEQLLDSGLSSFLVAKKAHTHTHTHYPELADH